jgi:hypothetical protein
MSAQGFVVPAGGGSVLDMAPGRAAALKLVSGETAGSTCCSKRLPLRRRDEFPPAPRQRRSRLGAERRDHLQDRRRRDSRRAGHLRPASAQHAWKNTSAETDRILFLYTPANAGGFFKERLRRPEGSANEMRRRHGLENVGPPPF